MMKKRILSMVLAFSLCLSLTVVTLPVASAAYNYDPKPANGVAFLNSVATALCGILGLDVSSIELEPFLFASNRVGLVTYEQLEEARDYYNTWYVKVVRNFVGSGGTGLSSAVIAFDDTNNIWRLADSSTGKWILDKQGRFPYFEVVAAGMDSVAEIPADCNPAPELDKIHGNVWIEDSVAKANLVSHDSAYSYDQLKAFANTLNSISSNLPSTPYFRVASFGSDGLYGLQKLTPAGDGDHIGWLANKNKSPYLTTRDKYQLAVNQQNNYYIQDNSGQNITNENGTYAFR